MSETKMEQNCCVCVLFDMSVPLKSYAVCITMNCLCAVQTVLSANKTQPSGRSGKSRSSVLDFHTKMLLMNF